MSVEKKLFSNTFYIFLDIFFINLFSLLYTLIIWKMLPPQDYGVIMSATNLSLLLSSFCSIGFTSANSKLISEYSQKKQFKKIGALLKFSFSVSLILSAIFSLVIISLYFYFPNLFNLPNNAIFISCISISLLVASGLFASLLHGLQNMRKYFLSDAIGYGVKVALTFLLLLFGFGYFGALISFALCYLLIFLARFERKWFTLRGEINKKFVFYEYALPALFLIIFSLFINNSQYVILNFFEGPKATGIFGTALTISFVVTLIPNILSASLFPIVSQLSVNKKGKPKQSYLTSIVTRYILLFSLPFLLFLSIFSKTIVLFFSGKEYLPSTSFLPILCLASFFFGFGNFFLSSIYAIKKPKISRNISVAFTLIFLLLALLLTHYFSSWGLALAYLLTTFTYFLTTFKFLRKFLSIRNLVKPLIKILLSSSIFAIFLILIENFIFNFYFKLILLVISCLAYLVILVPLRFYEQEEVRILNYLGRKVKIFSKIFFKIAEFLSNYT